MRFMPIFLIALGAVVFASCAKKPAGILGKEVSYGGGGALMKGYLAYNPDVNGKRPGILVVHEWWGQNDYARMRARMLADLGYVAFAVDMYGNDSVATNPTDAGRMAGESMRNLDTAKARFDAALDVLKQQPSVDPSRIAAIGYCYGGGVVLQMARLGDPLAGVVSFHGSLPSDFPAAPGEVKTKMLICNGADDPVNPPAKVAGLRKALDSLGIDYKFVDYPGAKHAFTNPASDSVGKLFSIPVAYNEAADKGSWAEMQTFFQRIFPK